MMYQLVQISLCTTWYIEMQPETKTHRTTSLERCLAAYVEAGTMDLSLDQIAQRAGTSKRMLVHYFGRREALEEEAMALLEDRLRAQFAPQNFPASISPESVLCALWDRSTQPRSKGVLLLVMDLSRRAWNGSARAKSFYEEQQRLWEDLLLRYLPDPIAVKDILQSFQGAILAYLITGDPKPGRSMIERLSTKSKPSKSRLKTQPAGKRLPARKPRPSR
jgi:AcrR family transcriptional regulator